ncbi:hypothetical protein HAV_00791 [Candidatus Hepatincola sp. Av]
MLNKPLQLSILFHVMLLIVCIVVAKYQKPVTKIQVSLVNSVPNITKETKTKAFHSKLESPKKPIRKFHNIIIKNFKEKETAPKIVKNKEVVKKKKNIPIKKQLVKANTMPTNSRTVTSKSSLKNKRIELADKVNSKEDYNKNLNSEVAKPLIKKDSLPTLNSVTNEVTEESIIEKDIPRDLEDLDLSDADKQILAKNLSNCVASLPAIREHDEVLFLSFTINEDAIVENVDIIRNNQKVPQEQLSNLEQRVVSIFHSKACSKLLLPPNGFTIWHKFSVKLRLEGFFNE